jgi:hypothetical protein
MKLFKTSAGILLEKDQDIFLLQADFDELVNP